MFGVILAAGVGSRLRPMTNNKPKCLVTSARKSILQYQLDSYIKAGIPDVYLVVGYEGDAVRDYCKHIKDINIHIVENDVYEETNNMYSLYLIKDFVKGQPFILNNADLTIDDSLVAKMRADTRDDLVAVDVGLYNDESMKVVLNDEDFIVDISKQVGADISHGCSIDFYKFSANSSEIFFGEIERIIETEKNLKEWTEVAMQRLFQKQALQFNAFDIESMPWVEIDNYDDLALSDKIFSQQNKTLLDYSHYCFDLDGTVYVGDTVIPGVIDTIQTLRDKGKTIHYLSNNSSKNKEQYAEKLRAMGLTVATDDIVLSTDSALKYLKRNQVKKLFVLGTASLQKLAMDSGFEICSHEPEFVLVGYDTELQYAKLVTASRLINREVDFIATHCDLVCPTENGPVPDVGLLIRMLEDTTGKKVYKVFGKPNVEMINDLCEDQNLDRREMLIVGDRLYTDIEMSTAAGVDSLLVLTGDTSRSDMEFSNTQPTYVLNSLAEITC